MPHFFVHREQIKNESLVILGSDVHHLRDVMRARRGDELTVADGESNLYHVKINGITPDQISTVIIKKSKISSEPKIELMLVQAIPKNPKMEFIIQKCVELGVSSFLPVCSERTIPRYTIEKKNILVDRWQEIATEASKQSGRGKIPRILHITDWSHSLELIKGMSLIILPWEGEKRAKFKDLLVGKRKIKNAAILIGPEGGLTQQEVERAKKAGARPVTLGPRILRTETAGLVSCAIFMYEMGYLE